MMSVNFSDIAISDIKSSNYCGNEDINLMENADLAEKSGAL